MASTPNARPEGRRDLSSQVRVAVARFTLGWRQFWQGYWQSPTSC